MAVRAKSIVNLPFSAIVTLIVTTVLFISIPLLTEVSTTANKGEKFQHVMISQRRPPPPPEPEKEKKLEEQIKREASNKKTIQKQRMAQPKLNFPAAVGLNAGISGTVEINGLLKQDFQVSDSLFVTAFNLDEVDQRPRVIRSALPAYPFAAQQKGIEGKVIVRFVVDRTGQAQEPEVVKVEPREVEGVFEESSLAVVKRYKFRPAMKAGKAVDCIVNLPIKYSLTE